MIVRDNSSLRSQYRQLAAGDIVYGRISLKPGEEHILFDLADRGVRFIPSAKSQLASRSKTFQAIIFKSYMLPETIAIYDRHDLLRATSLYARNNLTTVILKREGKNGGLGVHKFASIEDLYNQVCGGGYPFPFVIQPFVANYSDIRVIMLGEYHEAYRRSNPHNFRQNMHCGGKSSAYQITGDLRQFCLEVMACGKFPYAHLDIMITEGGKFYLQEINLRGGLRGAQISGGDYCFKIEAIHKDHLARICAQS